MEASRGGALDQRPRPCLSSQAAGQVLRVETTNLQRGTLAAGPGPPLDSTCPAVQAEARRSHFYNIHRYASQEGVLSPTFPFPKKQDKAKILKK
jgi:hypothetical protein